jgi:hypothetical protein
MLLYVSREYERLYGCLCYIESQDMSEKGHIVCV